MRGKDVATIVRTGLLIAAPCVLAGCGGSTAAEPQARLPEVAVETLRVERVVLTTELPGRTVPYLVAEIRPQVNGIIQQRLFTEGSDVKRGQLLYLIDPAPYKAAYDQAKAGLAVAEANLPALRARAERFGELAEIHAVGRQDYDDAKAALVQAEATATAGRAAIEVARVNLSYTPLSAPIPGRIGKSTVTVGALVTAYQPVPLAVVQQLDPIYVDVTQSSADVLRLRRRAGLSDGTDGRSATTVRLLLEDGTPYTRDGRLQFRDVTVNPTTGSVILRLVFPNPDHVLLPGMFVRAVIEEGVNEKAVLVPQQSVTRDARGNAAAFVVNDQGRVEQRRLELDRAIGDRWLVTTGLAAGDRVVVEGTQSVQPGIQVRTVPATPPPGGPASAGSGRPATTK